MRQRQTARAAAMNWQGAAFPLLMTTATLAGFCAMLLRFG